MGTPRNEVGIQGEASGAGVPRGGLRCLRLFQALVCDGRVDDHSGSREIGPLD